MKWQAFCSNDAEKRQIGAVMQRNILLLFDNIDIREEAVNYAIALAGRMKACITILLLLRLDFESERINGSDLKDIQELSDAGDRAVSQWLEKMSSEGTEGVGIVRVGEPASELLKFLAEGMEFDTVIWGGDRAIVGGRRLRLGEHWMTRIMDKLGCPMVAP